MAAARRWTEHGYVDGRKRGQVDGTGAEMLGQKLADKWRVGDQRTWGECPFLPQIETKFISQLLCWHCRAKDGPTITPWRSSTFKSRFRAERRLAEEADTALGIAIKVENGQP